VISLYRVGAGKAGLYSRPTAVERDRQNKRSLILEAGRQQINGIWFHIPVVGYCCDRNPRPTGCSHRTGNRPLMALAGLIQGAGDRRIVGAITQ